MYDWTVITDRNGVTTETTVTAETLSEASEKARAVADGGTVVTVVRVEEAPAAETLLDSAVTKLMKLGLTADEARAIAGVV